MTAALARDLADLVLEVKKYARAGDLGCARIKTIFAGVAAVRLDMATGGEVETPAELAAEPFAAWFAEGVATARAAFARKREPRRDVPVRFTVRPGGNAAARSCKVARRKADLYPTHPAGTIAFLNAEGDRLLRRFPALWEPACGPGFLARVLEAYGFEVFASDLHDYGHGKPGMDFLATTRAPALAPAVVTNPPYGSLARAFVRHAVLDLNLPYVALLLKSCFWHAADRIPLFHQCPPSVIYPLGFRLHWDGRGRPVQTHSWMVWDIERRPTFGPVLMPALPKPRRWPDVGFDAYARSIAA